MIAKAGNSGQIVSLKGVPQISDGVKNAIVQIDAFGEPLPPDIIAEADQAIAEAKREIRRRAEYKSLCVEQRRRERAEASNPNRGLTISALLQPFQDDDEEDYDDED